MEFKLKNFILEKLKDFQDATAIETLNFNVPSENQCYETEQFYVAMIHWKEYDSITFMVGKPYVYKGEPEELSYGWSFKGNTALIENAYKPCNPCWDDTLVVAFSEYKEHL